MATVVEGNAKYAGIHPPVVGKLMEAGHQIERINALGKDLDLAFSRFEEHCKGLNDNERVSVTATFSPWVQVAWEQWRKTQAEKRTVERGAKSLPPFGKEEFETGQ